MSWKTNRKTGKRFRSRPVVFAPPGQPECICMGECIGNTGTPCPFRGYKKLGGYCRRCYKNPDPSKLSPREQEFRRMTLADKAELDYRKTLVTEMGQGIRCEYCGMTRDKCECIRDKDDERTPSGQYYSKED